MTSRIGVMYQEARNTVRSAPVQRIENFLTEMLSLAVLADWRPMAELLSTVDAVRGHFLIERIRPYTQQQVVAGDNNFNRGRVDLALAIDRNDGGADEVWIEVKAGSPFSGDQLDRYLKAIADAEAAKDRTCRRLIVLGPSGTAVPKQYRDCVPVLTWQTLVRTVQEASEASPLWIDFADFLLEAPGNLVPRDPGQEPVLSAEWIAGAITVALKDPVGWCNWERGRVLTRIRKLQSELGRPCIRRWAPWQITYVELGSTREHPGSLSVRLCVAARYGIPYEALWRRAQASGLAITGGHWGRAVAKRTSSSKRRMHSLRESQRWTQPVPGCAANSNLFARTTYFSISTVTVPCERGQSMRPLGRNLHRPWTSRDGRQPRRRGRCRSEPGTCGSRALDCCTLW